MKAPSVFYRRPLRTILIFATWWTLIFWTLPFIYLCIKGQETFTSANWFVIISGIIAMITAVFIYISMWIYLFVQSRDPRSNRILWGIVFFFTGWYGSCVYFLTVYRRDFLAAPFAPRQQANPTQFA